jgi:pyroglutamyl-peptidase
MTQAARRPRILVTGFGPFPGQPINASAALVTALGEDDAIAALPAEIATDILPTDWRQGPARAGRVADEFRPDAIVHFGVSAKARHFEIETRAFNAARRAPDCAGALPEGYHVLRGAPPMLAATLPAQLLLRRLRLAGLPASLSRDAGRYLCNATLYRSLARSSKPGTRARVGFIHMPALAAAHDGTFDTENWLDLTRGARIILHTLAGFLRASSWKRSANAMPDGKPLRTFPGIALGGRAQIV